ncbi:MAG: ComF family protein [Desulfitobacterium hafniense]|nr:ComF family protein [Desulfitobacterium hafniense]
MKIEFLNSLKSFTQEILYDSGKPCVLCGKPAGPVCSDCNDEYFFPQADRCHMCGKIIKKGKHLCDGCTAGHGPKKLSKVTAWGNYEGAWKEFIWAVKFKYQPYRLVEIGKPFSQWALTNLPPVDALVPIPMHFEREAERGFNQAEVIASLLHWELGIPLLKVLERIAPTNPQVGLTRLERLNNLKGVINLSSNSVQGLSLWLIDDVTTTGATLEAGAEALLKGGAKEVYGLCLAAGIEKSLVTPVD